MKVKQIDMKKTMFIILLVFGLGQIGFSQTSAVEEELKILYADGDYQKLANKAIKYSEKKYANDPVVYIYASMACLRMSQNYETSQEFPKSFGDALSYASKYRKKDVNGQYYSVYLSHFEELKKIVGEEIENSLLEENKEKLAKAAKKSLGLLNKINTFDPDDKGAMLLKGYLEILVQNTMEGRKIIKEYLPYIKEIKATRSEMPVVETPPAQEGKKPVKGEVVISPSKPFEEMSEMEQVYLRMALMSYAKYLFGKGNVAEAKEIIEIGKPFFLEENEMYQAKYDTKYKGVYKDINS